MDTVDYSKKWLVMASVGLGVFLSTLDGSIVNVALPTLTDEFDASIAAIQWVVLGYLLTIGTLILIVGRLGDMYGKKGIYTTGFTVFTLASMTAGLSPNVQALIGFRIVQAVGAAMVAALGIAILTEAFPPHERGRALGMIGSIVSIGIIAGPTLGGILIDQFSWRWIFFVNLPIGILGTLAALRWVPNIRPQGRQQFDVPGAITMFVTLLALLLALTLGQDLGYGSAPIIGLFVVALVSFGAFLAIERRAAQPMINLEIFKNILFSVNLANGFLVFLPLAGIFFVAPFFLTNAMGLDPLQVGLALAAAPVAIFFVSPVAGWWADRVGPRPITVLGLVVLLLGWLAMQRLDANTTLGGFVLLLAPIGIGMAIFQSPNNSIIMGSVRPERLGIAGGLLSLTRTLGQVAGIAVVGTVWSLITAREGGLDDPTAVLVGTKAALWLAAATVGVSFVLALWGWKVERERMASGEIPAHSRS